MFDDECCVDEGGPILLAGEPKSVHAALPYLREHDLVEFFPAGGRRKDFFSAFYSVNFAIWGADVVSQGFNDFGNDAGVFDDFAGDDVGVDDLYAHLLKEGGRGGFSGADAAGECDFFHFSPGWLGD